MPRDITVTFEDGSSHVYRGAPDDVTPDQVSERAGKEFGRAVTALDGGRKAEEPGMMATAGAGLGNGFGSTVLGAQKLVGKGLNAIGEKLTPDETTLSSLVTGEKKRGLIQRGGDWLIRDADEGRAKLAGQFSPYKEANPITGAVSEFGGEMAAGGAAAKGVGLALKGAGAVNLGNAVATSGMTGGGMLTRSAGAAGAGALSAEMVDEGSAGGGALIGAATPGILKAAGRAGETVASLLRPFTSSGQERIAADILRQYADDPIKAVAALKQAGAQLVPGSQPLTAAAAGDVGLAGLTRTMQNASPGFSNELATRATAQNTARTNMLEGMAGNPGKIATAKEARDTATDAMREGVLSRARPVDAQGMVSAIDAKLADPNNAGQLSQQVLTKYRDLIAKRSKDGAIDARALYELRKDINLELGGKLQGEAGNLRYASGQLADVKAMIDDAIEAASARPTAGPSASRELVAQSSALGPRRAPGAVGPAGKPGPYEEAGPTTGWRDYLSTYSEMSRPIDRMVSLRDLTSSIQNGTTDMAGNLMLSPAKLNNLLKTDGAALAKILTPEEMQAVRNLAADMNAGTLALTAGKAVGSNTVQNLAQDRVLQSALGKLGASPLATSTLGTMMKLPYIRANEQIQQRIGDALLDPAVAQRLMSADHVPLSSLLNPQLAYRGAPLLATDQ